MKKNRSLILGLLVLSVVFSSCGNKLDLAPVSTISDGNFWKTAISSMRSFRAFT